MSFDVFRACLDKIPLDTEIYFSGFCEPWSNPQCSKMVLYTHSRRHKINVSTTLVGMRLLDVEMFESVPFKRFFIHLPSVEGYENIKVDKDYLAVLEKISRSRIGVSYRFHGKDVHPGVRDLLKGVHKENVELMTRCANIEIKGVPHPEIKRGAIFCERLLRLNVLLPNGDVVLCCMDYSLSHILGNLLSSDYASLFKGSEFLAIQKRLKERSTDILCRYCCFAYSLNFSARLYRGIQKLKSMVIKATVGNIMR